MEAQPNHDGLVNNCPAFYLDSSQHSQGSWDPSPTPFHTVSSMQQGLQDGSEGQRKN